MELRRHLRAAAEHPCNAHLLQRYLLAKSFQQFGRGEQAADIVRAQQREPLFDDVQLVGLGLVEFAALEELDDPARIEIGHETDAAAVLRQMLDSQTEAA